MLGRQELAKKDIIYDDIISYNNNSNRNLSTRYENETVAIIEKNQSSREANIYFYVFVFMRI